MIASKGSWCRPGAGCRGPNNYRKFDLSQVASDALFGSGKTRKTWFESQALRNNMEHVTRRSDKAVEAKEKLPEGHVPYRKGSPNIGNLLSLQPVA